MKMFDEKEAIAFIKANADCGSLNEDKILDIVDAIFDFYDENGELELDFDDDETDEDDADAESIAAYISKGFPEIDQALLSRIVKAEIDYENSLL